MKNTLEYIKDNLRAYKANFEFITIEKAEFGKGYYVYTTPNRKDTGAWTQYCPNKDYLDGWLYGAVQAINGCCGKRKDGE